VRRRARARQSPTRRAHRRDTPERKRLTVVNLPDSCRERPPGLNRAPSTQGGEPRDAGPGLKQGVVHGITE
jgi:hypothetical protein